MIPTDVANCVLWLDASQEAYAHGAAVPTWTDRSGSANNATQGTAANQPTFHTNIRNGLPGLLFDGTSDWMSLATSPFNIQAGTSFAVFQANTYTQDGTRPARYVLGFLDASNRRWYIQHDVSTTRFRTSVGSGAGDNGPSDLDWHVAWLRANGNAKTSWFSCANGVRSFSDAATGTSGRTDGIGKIANGGGWQEGWGGYISEIIHYSRSLTDGELNQVRNYLTDRWAIPNCLGSPVVGYIGTGPP